MTKDVLVSISGMQFMEDSNDLIEVVTSGDYYIKNGKQYIIYEECLMQDFNDMVKNIIKVSENTVEVTRKGSLNVHLVFEEGKSSQTYYNTPIGNLLIGLNTEKININQQEHTLDINIKYGIEMNYKHIYNSEINIVVKSKSII